MTNMTNTKPGVTETNDFGYYIQLKKTRCTSDIYW